MAAAQSPIRRPVRRDEVPADGLRIAIDADAGARAKLAPLLAIPGVRSLRADLVVAPWRRDGLVVRGRLEAEVVQTCVVTLEPFFNTVSEVIEDYFAPDPARLGSFGPGDETVDPEDVDELEQGRVDVGTLVVEHLSLGLDPYPRKPGVVFESDVGTGKEDDAVNPFAALAGLKRRDEGS